MTPLSTLLLKKLKPHPWCLSFLMWPTHQKVSSPLIPCLTNIIAPHWIQASSLLGLLRPPPQRDCPHFCSSSSPSATHPPDHVMISPNPSDDVPLWPNSYPDLPGPMGSDPNLFLDLLLFLFPTGFYASTIMVFFSSLSLAKLLPDSRSLYWPGLLFGTSLCCYRFFFSFKFQCQSYPGWEAIPDDPG